MQEFNHEHQAERLPQSRSVAAELTQLSNLINEQIRAEIGDERFYLARAMHEIEAQTDSRQTEEGIQLQQAFIEQRTAERMEQGRSHEEARLLATLDAALPDEGSDEDAYLEAFSLRLERSLTLLGELMPEYEVLDCSDGNLLLSSPASATSETWIRMIADGTGDIKTRVVEVLRHNDQSDGTTGTAFSREVVDPDRYGDYGVDFKVVLPRVLGALREANLFLSLDD